MNYLNVLRPDNTNDTSEVNELLITQKFYQMIEALGNLSDIEKEILGILLKSIRKEASLTRRNLVEKLNDYSEKTVEAIEYGKSAPSISYFCKFCIFFHIKPSQLLLVVEVIKNYASSNGISHINESDLSKLISSLAIFCRGSSVNQDDTDTHPQESVLTVES